MRRPLRRSVFARTLFLGLLLPCLYFGTASATFLFRVHNENGAPVNGKLPLAPALDGEQRIVIFAPHPDDETLGCAGLIQQATSAGSPVTVALMTNGDGFRVAVERQFRELRVKPEHYLRFASLRQQETYAALHNLGLARDQILFLGYPDRGLLPLWSDHWSPDRPYRSPYTLTERSPYEAAFRTGAAYCGQSILADVERILRERRPTDVYVTHPSDDHPDHTAASSFVTLALQRLQDEGLPWARSAKLRYYIIHRGDWPVPQGLYKTDPMAPPAELASLDTAWKTLPLTAGQTDTKSRSIAAYASQTAIMKRFLLSFARRSELFGELQCGSVQPAGSRNSTQALIRDWGGFEPVAKDPVNDSLLRDFQAGGDVRALYAARGVSRLYLRVETYQPVSPRVDFRITLRYFGDPRRGSSGGSYSLSSRPGRQVTPAGVPFASEGNTLDLSIPLRDIGYARRVAVNIETRFAGLQVDRTGYRFLDLH